jgi:dienelactone hydrolase
MLTRREMLSASTAAILPGISPVTALLAADGDDPTRVLGGEKSTDARLGAPITLNGYFPFTPPKSKEAWEQRRKYLREQLLVATGLWPMPEKTPLKPSINGAIERDGYTIEKVSFASLPGHYVTGNLYRPTAPAKSPRLLPGVLFAHGHWANGRLHQADAKTAEQSVKSGGEPDLERARYFMQAIPATLARLGFVVFQYDMVGVGDSLAIPHAAGFADAQGELRLQSAMGLQTWNSVRALDFLLSQPDVDPARIGMTGASGGGTQTFILAAIDDRIAAAFPAVMVSTGMQGGCVCENCSLLRLKTGNVEIAAMFAPKPLAMSAAKDWTAEIMTKGYPELQELYGLYGARDRVAARAWLEYGHQYNIHAREMMYSWFMKHLQGKDEVVKEPAFRPAPVQELSVYDVEHTRPKDELPADKLREEMARASDDRMAKLAPRDAASLKEFRTVVRTALRVMVNDELPAAFVFRSQIAPKEIDGLSVIRIGLGRKNEKDAVPCVVVKGPKDTGKKFVVWAHPKGKASLFENGKLVPAARNLVDAGYSIGAMDVLGVGENAFPQPYAVDKRYAGYTFGYNPSLLASRVHDVLTMLTGGPDNSTKTMLVGWGELGPVAIIAKALAGDAVVKTAADMNQFRFESIKDTADPMMLPGAVKYGGMPAFLALCAPGEVLVHNHKGTATGKLPKAAYDAAGASDKLTRVPEKLDDASVIAWLMK